MSRYLVEVKQVNNIPVTVDADSEQEAEEKVREGFGEPGQHSLGDIEIVSIRILDD